MMVFQDERADTLKTGHAFLSAEGGVSTGVYATLNCGPGSGDSADNIAHNRRRAAARIGADLPVLTPYQVHGKTAFVVEHDFGEDRPKADALVTRTPGMIIGVLTADCLPVLLADREAGVIAAAHAGWRGATAGVTDAAVEAMISLGARRDHIAAATGPTIQQPSYEVAGDMRAAAEAADSAAARFFAPGRDDAHFQFDLPGYVSERLKRAGIFNLWHSKTDTYASPYHFSYRRSTHQSAPDYGRQLSAIFLS